MLAAISPPAHDLSQSMPYSHTRTTSRSALPDLSLPAETKTCPGCQQTVMDDNGGVVIAFGQSFFHVDCFKCAKCHEKVTADTNLLLLSDGQPVCSNCSYKCSVCHQPILDEAIMTGDDSYHAHCFKCRSCHNRIDELMFAKTSHGIYCMKCHNQRVARSRRHAQKQKERENTVLAGGTSNPLGVPTAKQPPAPHDNAPPGPTPPDSTEISLSVSAASSAQTSQAADLDRDQQQDVPHTIAPVQSPHRTSSNASPSTTSPSVSLPADSAVSQTYSSGPSSPVVVVPPDGPEAGPQIAFSYLQREDSNDSGGAASFLTADGSLPGSALLAGLSSSRAGKRNSINPGMSIDYEAMSKELNRKISVSAPQSPSSPRLPTVDLGQNSSPAEPQLLLSREQISEGLARRPSRRTRTEPPTSTPASSMLSRSRSRTEFSSSTDPMGPLSHQNTMLERLPPRVQSLKASSQDPEALTRRPSLMDSAKSFSLGRSSSDERDRHKPGSSLSIDVEKSRAGYGVGKRPVSPAYKAGSPAHKVDVPHGIESGTDTSDGEREPSTKEPTRKLSLSSTKEKEAKKSRRQPSHVDIETKQSASQEEPGEDTFVNDAGDVDTEDESSPVERVSRSTFIAPAHPPIRFSVSGNGFQELLSQFDPHDPASFSALGEFLKMNEDAESRNDAGSSATSLNPDGGAASNERGRLSSSSSAATPTTVSVLSTGDNSSMTTISAPSSQGHEDSFLVLDRPGATNGVKSDILQRQRSVHNNSSISSSRSSSEKSRDPPASDDQQPSPQFTVTTPVSAAGRSAKLDQAAAVMKRLQDALQDTARRGMTQITLDQEFVQAVIMTIEQRRDESTKMKSKLDHVRRASQQAMDGLTVAHNECETELRVRREAEAEVTRLRILLSGQAARITALSGQGRREEQYKQLINDLRENLNVLEYDVAKLKVDRDVALAEMEEICSSRSSEPTTDRDGTTLSRSLSTRLDNLKAQYKSELMSLSNERESLLREIAELQMARNVFLEETTMLNVRNEELAHLNAHYMRRIEVAASSEPLPPVRENQSFEHHRPVQPLQPSHTVNTSIGISSDDSHESAKYVKVQQKSTTGDAALRVFKWRVNHKEGSTPSLAALDGPNEKSWLKHAFQNVSVLRLSKCDHCSEKLWGSQARCQICNISVHSRCQPNVQVICSPPNSSRRDDASAAGPLQPVMFGRELTEQVRADSKISDRMVPIIVEKCIAAVDATALDYEGIYRKTGGSGQSKLITQLFERGDYAAFDLLDRDRFNDICSTTSVLKSYFRTLPNPLLTFVLHDEFIFASSIQDPVHRSAKYADLVKQLPTEHYYTLRILMLHLNRIQEHREENLMTARNLGVVFGPTLMRSRNPAAEFSDMAGKALTIEWLVENAPTIFPPFPTLLH